MDRSHFRAEFLVYSFHEEIQNQKALVPGESMGSDSVKTQGDQGFGETETQTETLTETRILLEMLSRCPSPDNCQPWEIELSGPSQVTLRHHREVDQHKMNGIGLATHLCLGTMIETARIWSDRWGRQLKVEISDASGGRLQKTAILDFSMPKKESLDSLAQSHYERLLLRRTHRGLFSRSSMQPNLVLIEKLIAERFSGVHFQFQKPSRFLISFVKTVETRLWANEAFCRDLFKWFRFRRKSYEKMRDGLFYKELGVPRHESIGLSLFSFFPALFAKLSFFTRFGVLMNLSRTFRNCSGLAMTSVKSGDPLSQIEAGAASLRVWLELEDQGMSVQPCSLASFAIYYQKFYVDFFKDLEKLQMNLQNLEIEIYKELNLEKTWVPIWWFRTGLGEKVDSAPRSLRKFVKY